MKVTEYEEVISKTPRFVPIFRLKKIPGWANASSRLWQKEPLKVGMESNNDGTFGVTHADIGATYIEFIKYKQVNRR